MDIDGIDPLHDDDVLWSPPAGKVIKFTEKPEDPDTDPLRFEMWLAAEGSHGPMPHVHPIEDERLEVVAGQLGAFGDGERHVLDPGESITFAAGDRHYFWNASDERLHLRGSVDPGLRTEAFMRVTYGLARDGAPVTGSGMPLNLLRLAVFLDEYDDMLFLSALPVWLQQLGIRALAPVGRLAGYDNEYPEYLPP